MKIENMVQRFSCISLVKGALSGLRQLLATESPLKMMKNAFYFTLKALFVLGYLCFCLDVLSCIKTA